jgi:hypothetical protein
MTPELKLKAVNDPLFIRIGDLKLAPISWQIEGILEADTLSGIVGPSGSGKSFVALDMALSIASGENFHNNPVKKGAILFCAGEGKHGLNRRVKAWSKNRNIMRSDLPFYISQKTILMHDPYMVEAVKKEAEDIGNVRLVIIDTMARSFGGHNENNPQDMGAFIAACDYLKDSLKCTVTVVHHTGHGDKDRARGHSSFYAALDSEILVKAVGEHNIQISSTKMKDATPFKPMEFLKISIPVIDDETSLALELVPTRERPSKLTLAQAYTFQSFKEATKGRVSSDGLHLDDWRPIFHKGHVGDNPDSKNKAFQRGRDALVEKGFLKVENYIFYLGDKAT